MPFASWCGCGILGTMTTTHGVAGLNPPKCRCGFLGDAGQLERHLNEQDRLIRYPTITIWHFGSPKYNQNPRERSGGLSPGTVDEFTHVLAECGAVVTTAGPNPYNHYMIGTGVGHNDADFAESGRSMAAYYENGESWNGARWWEPGSSAREYYAVAS